MHKGMVLGVRKENTCSQHEGYIYNFEILRWIYGVPRNAPATVCMKQSRKLCRFGDVVLVSKCSATGLRFHFVGAQVGA